jgi:hypothetical protein
VVLVKFERTHTDDNNILLNEIVYYSKTYMNTISNSNRVMALSLLDSLLDIDHELVYQSIITNIGNL